MAKSYVSFHFHLCKSVSHFRNNRLEYRYCMLFFPQHTTREGFYLSLSFSLPQSLLLLPSHKHCLCLPLCGLQINSGMGCVLTLLQPIWPPPPHTPLFTSPASYNISYLTWEYLLYTSLMLHLVYTDTLFTFSCSSPNL